MYQPVSPTRHERDIRFANMKLMKQQILDIRQRKQNILPIPQPIIVRSFDQLYKYKANEIKKKMIIKRIQEKQKEFKKINTELQKYKQKYQQKQKSFKEKQHIFRVLTQKLQVQFQKTKTTFRDVGFNRAITAGVRKLNYYRIAQILFNDNARRVFSTLDNKSELHESSSRNQQEIGICIGYLGLLILNVGLISGSRIWFDFSFRGSKSVVKLNDGSLIVMRPKQARFKQGISVMIEQLYQIMHEGMSTKIQKSTNLYQICEQLSRILMS